MTPQGKFISAVIVIIVIIIVYVSLTPSTVESEDNKTATNISNVLGNILSEDNNNNGGNEMNNINGDSDNNNINTGSNITWSSNNGDNKTKGIIGNISNAIGNVLGTTINGDNGNNKNKNKNKNNNNNGNNGTKGIIGNISNAIGNVLGTTINGDNGNNKNKNNNNGDNGNNKNKNNNNGGNGNNINSSNIANPDPDLNPSNTSTSTLNSFGENIGVACSNPNNPGDWPADWSTNARSKEDCAESCLNSLTCVGVEYDESTGRCNISSSCTSDVAMNAPNYAVYNKQGIDLNHFTGLPAMACGSRNELGKTINYTSKLSECATLCLNDSTCTSFEYGDAGSCALSTTCTGDIATSFPTYNLYTNNTLGLNQFIAHKAQACKGRNELGTFKSGKTTSQCADQCLETDGCISFQYNDDGGCSLSSSCTADILTNYPAYITYILS